MNTMKHPDDSYRALLEAAAFAARAHQGQQRKDKHTPYVSHAFRVCLIVRDLFGFDDPRMMKTALLHDTIEDTATDFDDLAERFGVDVASWVAILSKDMRLSEDEREHAYRERLRHAPWQVQACKLADLLDNLMDLNTLPYKQRVQYLKRAQQYFEEFANSELPQLVKPVKLVEELLERLRAEVAKGE
jgi:(p)ppGpp synthase/HD superfamily hydrolase